MTAASRVAYNADGLITNVVRPDATEIRYGHNGVGRTVQIQSANSTWNRTYEPGTGRLVGSVASTGQREDYTYDGSLLLDEVWSGTVTGVVSRAYDADFRLRSLTVNGVHTVPFEYDASILRAWEKGQRRKYWMRRCTPC